jgi:hypothetical protein
MLYGTETFAQKDRSRDLRHRNLMNSCNYDVIIGSVTNINRAHLKQTFSNVALYG